MIIQGLFSRDMQYITDLNRSGSYCKQVINRDKMKLS